MKRDDALIEMESEGIPVLVDKMSPERPRFDLRAKPLPRGNERPISKLTHMQKKALENKFELGMGNKQAAIQAGYALSSAPDVIPKLMARKPIIDALKAKGITDEKIASVIAEGLDAMHPIRPEQPDHNARAKFEREANQVLDNYPPKKIQSEQRVIEIHLSGEDVKAIRKYEEMRNAHAS
jgi:hypothetical protein